MSRPCPANGSMMSRPCPACDGKGVRPKDTFNTGNTDICFWCHGSGEVVG